MKKKILIAILAVIVVAILSGCIIFRDEIGKVRHHIYPISKKYEKKNTDNDLEKATKKKEEETSTQTVQKSEEQNTETKNKEEQIENNSNKKEPTKTNSNKTTETSKGTPKNNAPSNSNNNGSGNTNNSVKQEEKPVVVQKQPWEELGLTEDQYKNQPMYSWEEVDFKTKDECMNYGNEHAEYGFECSEVTSWTRSLGWDYKTF